MSACQLCQPIYLYTRRAEDSRKFSKRQGIYLGRTMLPDTLSTSPKTAVSGALRVGATPWAQRVDAKARPNTTHLHAPAGVCSATINVHVFASMVLFS